MRFIGPWFFALGPWSVRGFWSLVRSRRMCVGPRASDQRRTEHQGRRTKDHSLTAESRFGNRSIALWYHPLADEGPSHQEVRGRNPGARSRIEGRAPQGNQARARAWRLARERRVLRRQGAATARR